jgi:hypothetical protein
MDSTTDVAIAHGLTFSKIRNISVNVYEDTVTTMFPLYYYAQAVGALPAGTWIVDGTNITLYRRDSGNFDSAFFNATDINRGFIIIEYVT